jgi:hypothetical protein
MSVWMENEFKDQAQAKIDELIGKITTVRIIFMMPGDIPVWYKDIQAYPGDEITVEVPKPGDIQIS